MLSSAVAGIADGGGAYGLLAVAMILLYRTTGVLNFAIAAVGTFGTLVTSVLYTNGWPVFPAALVGMATGGALSVAYGLIFVRWFFDSSVRYRATVAVAMLLATVAMTTRVFGETPLYMPTIVNGNAGTVAGVVVSGSGVLAIVVAVVVAGALTFTLAKSRIGRQLRGISQGPITCELLGVPVRALSIGVWAFTGVLGSLAMLLVAPGRSTSVELLGLLVVPGLAASLVAVFRHYWRAVVAGILLGAAQGILDYYNSVRVFDSTIPFVVILVLLLWFERREAWDEAR
ncbi:MAG: ABC transporter permease subunit [Solirubrobacteraceae bacterium]